jgi:dimethylamine/trimethylamine dehydrogenase
MGEEFRRGWHPERIRRRSSEAQLLVVGAGPAGLEAARALGVRGYEVVLAEATRNLGGRVTAESLLPGLSAWNRVRDYREQAITELPNVAVYRESPMSADDIAEFGFDNVIVATGANWRRDGVGRWHTMPVPVEEGAEVLSPDDLFAGRRPDGRRVVVYDDDHYYLGGVVAELLALEGYDVSIVTSGAQVSSWTANTFEVNKIQRRLMQRGVRRLTDTALQQVAVDHVVVSDVYSEEPRTVAADAVVMVTARLPREELLNELLVVQQEGRLSTVRGVGDCWAPGTIAAAVWSGRRAAEEFDEPEVSNDGVGFRREVTELALIQRPEA